MRPPAPGAAALLTLLLAIACACPLYGQTDYLAHLQSLQTNTTDSADDRLTALYDLAWAWQLESYPEFATYAGVRDYNDRWQDLSRPARDARNTVEKALHATLESIDPAELSAAKRLDYELLSADLALSVESQAFPTEYLLLNQMSGVHGAVTEYLTLMPAATVADFNDRIARLRAAPRLVEQHIVLLREGLASGVTPPRVTLRDVPDQIRNVLVDDVNQSQLMASFGRMPGTIPDAVQDSLRGVARSVIADSVYPALRRFLTFVEGEYVPGSRETVGLSSLPNGEAWYRHYVRSHTTTDLSPEEIHQIGLKEVARIRAEMERIKRDTGFDGVLNDFFSFMRTNPAFFAETPEALVREYRDIAKRADAELVRLFGKLPRLPYGVEPVPSYAEKSQTTAYYQPGSLRGARAGIYYVNTYNLASRPRWEMEALTLHESVPGHHLQLALADELEGVHDLRKYTNYTAFVEGWGLYAESLGPEMGFYEDPYSRFGQLTYEMWRAVRLVVDTGIHALGWTREQAIDYFRTNAPKSEHDVVVEVDRYIVWPGQALAYKIGELKLKQLRTRAQAQLGDDFDIRAFHDRVLESGALPLDVLEARIDRWLRAEKGGR